MSTPLNSIDRTGADALIPVEISNEIIKEVPTSSKLLPMMKRLPNMSAKQKTLPVQSTLPEAYFLSGDTAFKQTSKAEWEKLTLTAEELAVIIPIPEAVLKGAKENEFYYYLFFKPERKVIFYQFKEGSSAPENSESFHKQIVSYLGKVLIDGNYKNNYVSERGAALYEEKILENNKAAHYQPKKEDSKKYQAEMLAKKAEIDAVKAFYRECAATMCIINPKTSEYVVINKRDIEVAKKTLQDYKRW